MWIEYLLFSPGCHYYNYTHWEQKVEDDLREHQGQHDGHLGRGSPGNTRNLAPLKYQSENIQVSNISVQKSRRLNMPYKASMLCAIEHGKTIYTPFNFCDVLLSGTALEG